MHGDAELKRFTNGGCFHTRANAAPESSIEQYNIDSSVQNIDCQLFEVDNNRVRGERHADLLTHAAHSVHAKHGIFEVIVAHVFDLLTKPDRGLSGPHAVRIEAK